MNNKSIKFLIGFLETWFHCLPGSSENSLCSPGQPWIHPICGLWSLECSDNFCEWHPWPQTRHLKMLCFAHVKKPAGWFRWILCFVTNFWAETKRIPVAHCSHLSSEAIMVRTAFSPSPQKPSCCVTVFLSKIYLILSIILWLQSLVLVPFFFFNKR